MDWQAKKTQILQAREFRRLTPPNRARSLERLKNSRFPQFPNILEEIKTGKNLLQSWSHSWPHQSAKLFLIVSTLIRNSAKIRISILGALLPILKLTCHSIGDWRARFNTVDYNLPTLQTQSRSTKRRKLKIVNRTKRHIQDFTLS